MTKILKAKTSMYDHVLSILSNVNITDPKKMTPIALLLRRVNPKALSITFLYKSTSSDVLSPLKCGLTRAISRTPFLDISPTYTFYQIIPTKYPPNLNEREVTILKRNLRINIA